MTYDLVRGRNEINSGVERTVACENKRHWLRPTTKIVPEHQRLPKNLNCTTCFIPMTFSLPYVTHNHVFHGEHGGMENNFGSLASKTGGFPEHPVPTIRQVRGLLRARGVMTDVAGFRLNIRSFITCRVCTRPAECTCEVNAI